MPKPLATGLCAAAAMALLARSARAEGDPPVATVGSIRGFHVERKPRLALAITGASIFAAGYIGSVIVALASQMRGISPVVLVPLAGPWIGFGYDMTHPTACPLDANVPDCGAFAVDVELPIVGALQLIGATMFGVGMIRHDVKKPVSVAPTFSFVGGPVVGIRGVF